MNICYFSPFTPDKQLQAEISLSVSIERQKLRWEIWDFRSPCSHWWIHGEFTTDMSAERLSNRRTTHRLLDNMSEEKRKLKLKSDLVFFAGTKIYQHYVWQTHCPLFILTQMQLKLYTAFVFSITLDTVTRVILKRRCPSRIAVENPYTFLSNQYFLKTRTLDRPKFQVLSYTISYSVHPSGFLKDFGLQTEMAMEKQGFVCVKPFLWQNGLTQKKVTRFKSSCWTGSLCYALYHRFVWHLKAIRLTSE